MALGIVLANLVIPLELSSRITSALWSAEFAPLTEKSHSDMLNW